MGGRGSQGGTRSTYRGDSTARFRERLGLGGGNTNTGVVGAGGGGGGGGSKSGTGSAGTGGVTGGQGGGGTGSGGGSVVAESPTKDINEFELPADASFEDQFEASESFEAFEERFEKAHARDKDPDATVKAYKREYKKAFDKWMTSQDAGRPAGPPALPVEFTWPDDKPEDEAAKLEQKYKDQINQLPKNLRDKLSERGVKIFIADKGKNSPGWGTGPDWDADETTGDGRTIGELSFYDYVSRKLIISDDTKNGSKNVMVHEMGHALDDQWLGPDGDTREWPEDSGDIYDIHRISRDDPEFTDMHVRFILNNENIPGYYRNGNEGSEWRGREETFAEGLATYFNQASVSGHKAGVLALRGFLGGREPADIFVRIMQLYGIIKEDV